MRNIPVILFGAGAVGLALLRQLLSHRGYHARQYGLRFDVISVCDSLSTVAVAEPGIDDTSLGDIIALKQSGSPLSDHALGKQNDGDLAAVLDVAERPGTTVVDCTATEKTVPALLEARARSYKVVLANKKPLTMSQEVYNRLTRAGATDKPLTLSQSRWETTVGAGLPVIATLNRLVSSGDPIQRIAGTFSGTLGYVMTGLQTGRPVSAVVREAHRLGYTEPDPRDDLGGVDVARKALILARGMGWELEMDDVNVVGLYPPSMDDLSVDAFLDALVELDAQFSAEVAAAAEAGQVLRYAATVEDGRCSVGPTLVDAESPLGRLTGTDNLCEFQTAWYSPEPLVIQGRGAGVDVTAAGVLSDILELAYTA